MHWRQITFASHFFSPSPSLCYRNVRLQNIQRKLNCMFFVDIFSKSYFQLTFNFYINWLEFRKIVCMGSNFVNLNTFPCTSVNTIYFLNIRFENKKKNTNISIIIFLRHLKTENRNPLETRKKKNKNEMLKAIKISSQFIFLKKGFHFLTVSSND